MSFFEYDLSNSISTFNLDLLHLHSSYDNESSYTNQDVNKNSEMLENFQFVSLFNTIWNLLKNKKSNSNSDTITSDLISPATRSLRRETDLHLQQYIDQSTFDEPPLHSVLKPVVTSITSLSTSVGSSSISLPRIDLTTVRSNDTLIHTFPVGLRAKSGGVHHLGNTSYCNTNSVDGLSENQSNSNSKKTCAICMDLINDQFDLIKLSCTHFFHAKSCIIPWIERNPSCPVCRYKLLNIDPLFRENNSSLPDHLYQTYYKTLFKNHSHHQSDSNPTTYSRQNSNHQAVVTATIWDSYSRFMM